MQKVLVHSLLSQILITKVFFFKKKGKDKKNLYWKVINRFIGSAL